MEHVTLGLAILLAVGMLAAKIGQKIKLPSVTGYILAGLLLGPSGFGIVTPEILGDKLDHFTQIALMLIAFGIGEKIEIKRLQKAAVSIGLISILEATGALLMVTAGSFVVARVSGLNAGSWVFNDYLVFALLLGAVSIATAPATTLHVIREMNAKGPLTSTLMAVVAVDNGLAIMFFGLTLSIAGHVVGAASGSLTGAVLASFTDISFSLIAGVVTGLAISYILPKLNRQEEMLTSGLALLLLCGEISRFFQLSPLLAGMAAGFTVINRVTRDIRLFRALNAFEPPVYVLFFTLAGSQLELSALSQAGWVGLVYFFFRIVGKYCGAFLGGRLAKSIHPVQNYLGLSLVPQAGVAIGLIMLINADDKLAGYSETITSVVLAAVVLSELIGPVCTRLAVQKAGEFNVTDYDTTFEPGERLASVEFLPEKGQETIRIIPWSWEKLVPNSVAKGVVAFGVSNPLTATGLARMATIIAHHFGSLPMSVRVLKKTSTKEISPGTYDLLFDPEKKEVKTLGYELQTELIQHDDVASGIITAAAYNNAKAVVLGYPLEGTFQNFQHILETVAKHLTCPVIVVRFVGVLHTERILVPITSIDDFDDVASIVHALSQIGEHQITVLYLLSPDESSGYLQEKKELLSCWFAQHEILSKIKFKAEKTEARQETILKESANHDLIVMGTSRKNVLKRLFFGSLAETVARLSRKPLLIVCHPEIETIDNGKTM